MDDLIEGPLTLADAPVLLTLFTLTTSASSASR